MMFILLGLSVVLLGRSFYILYVRKNRTRATAVITWASATFMVGFWTLYMILKA
jgi:hypothetical protein